MAEKKQTIDGRIDETRGLIRELEIRKAKKVRGAPPKRLADVNDRIEELSSLCAKSRRYKWDKAIQSVVPR